MSKDRAREKWDGGERCASSESDDKAQGAGGTEDARPTRAKSKCIPSAVTHCSLKQRVMHRVLLPLGPAATLAPSNTAMLAIHAMTSALGTVTRVK